MSSLTASQKAELVRSVEQGLSREAHKPVTVFGAYVIPHGGEFLFCGLTDAGDGFVLDSAPHGQRRLHLTGAQLDHLGCGSGYAIELK
jgi:hypothetical protein